ncbi:hypothetical protein VNO80_24703 [Phaseolus coccineus]|uniref:Uncharacterized protein n=1 Tax=Phaseolus coccineus TaxID=3886 RepID=A0AAN9QN34_PHACN
MMRLGSLTKLWTEAATAASITTLCCKVVDFVVMLVWFCLCLVLSVLGLAYPLATVFRVMTRGRCGL